MIDYGTPYSGKKLERLKIFLENGGLKYEDDIQFTTNIIDDDFNIMATGSLQDNIIKCILVDDAFKGEGLTGTLLTALISHAVNLGHSHLFLFTKPANSIIFEDFGFSEITCTKDVLFMENTRNGIKKFVDSLESPIKNGRIASIVCNCNPFTLGHLYLMEYAAKRCDLLHIFVLSEDKSEFSSKIRFQMVQNGVMHIKNALVHPTADYLISSATFPTYFLKKDVDVASVNTELDLTIFKECFAQPMGINIRFVGTEPYSAVTNAYNNQMKAFFKDSAIELIEIPRKTFGDEVISASRVRALLKEGKKDEAYALVPNTTKEILNNMF